MLDPTGWRLRGTISYGQRGDRLPEKVRWEFSSQLLRVSPKFAYIKATWNVSGSLTQEFEGLQSSPRAMPFTEKLALMAKCSRYSVLWSPPKWITPGFVRFWEYMLPLSDDQVSTLSQLEGFKNMPVIINPVVRAATSRETDRSTSTQSAVLIANEPRRVGGTIFNRSATAVLSIEFDAVATSNSVHKINPGGLLDIPISWVGPIAGIWDKVEANGKATIVEMLS